MQKTRPAPISPPSFSPYCASLNVLGPKNQGFDFGVDVAGEAVGGFSFAGNFFAACRYTFHDLLLHGQRWERDLQAAQFNAVDVGLPIICRLTALICCRPIGAINDIGNKFGDQLSSNEVRIRMR